MDHPTLPLSVYRAVLARLEDAVAIIDLDGVYLEQNEAHRALLGYDDRELEGATPALHLGEAVFDEVASALSRTGEYRGPVTSTARDGRRRRVELHAFTLRDEAGQPVCHVGIKRDPADRERAETRLDHSTSLLRATLESTTDGLLVVDRTGRIVLHNKRFRSLWGLTEQDLAAGDEHALGLARGLVADPDDFVAKVRELYANPERTSFDVLELADGRIFERYSRPQRLGDEIVGRVWSFRDVTETFRAQAALRESETRYRSLFQESRHAVYVTRGDGTFVDANPAALELFGVRQDGLARLNSTDLYVDPGARKEFQRVIARQGSVVDYPVRLRSVDGRVMDCLLTATARLDDEGRVVAYQGIIQDVTEQRSAEEALRESEQKFRALIENASDTITILDAQGTIVYESPSLTRVLGYEAEDLVGHSVFEYVHPQDRSDVLAQFRRLVQSPQATIQTEIQFRHAEGTWRWMDVVGRNLLDNPAVGGVVVNARDVTERKEVEERLVHDAFHDKLTRLPNRALLLNRVAKLLQRAHRSDAPPFAVLFLDLDRFKVVNDSLGHMVGDQLLTALARRLQDCLRPGDTVARLGGDEFTMLLDDADEEEATAVAGRIQRELERPFPLGSHEIYTSVSIGIATSANRYESPEEMLRDADLAMYRAKDRGRNRHEIFDSAMHEEAVERLQLETDLRRAMEREELVVHYQPILDLDEGVIMGFEALVRWEHPERGLLLPRDFMGLAEDTGLIVPLGWWVLDRVAAQLSDWGKDEVIAALPVQVNLSVHQLARSDLMERIAASLDRHACPPGCLHVELTESTMMENAESTVHTLQELKRLGIGISIDDFGTGYSSLSYLHRFPTDWVKIDRTFVARMGPRGDGAGVVRTIVDLAHDLGMRVVAEGIEHDTQEALLRSMRCEAGQGFLYSRAVPPERATELIRSWGRLR